MTFGNQQQQARNEELLRSAAPTTPAPAPPAYNPVVANATTLASSMVGLRGSKRPELSSSFASLVGGAGGLGRKPSTAKRALIGGA